MAKDAQQLDVSSQLNRTPDSNKEIKKSGKNTGKSNYKTNTAL